MGIDGAVGIGLDLITLAFGAAKNAGLLGKADWVKYAESGMFIAAKLKDIVADIVSNPTKYDTMTPQQIKDLLTPKSWDEIEAQAQAEIDAGK